MRSSVKYPRATPAWFVATIVCSPASFARRIAAALRGRRRTRSTWLTYPTSSQTVPSRSMMIARRPIPVGLRCLGRTGIRVRGRRFPSPVHPEPLFRIAADPPLHDRRARGGEAPHVPVPIVGRLERDRGLRAHGDCTVGLHAGGHGDQG